MPRIVVMFFSANQRSRPGVLPDVRSITAFLLGVRNVHGTLAESLRSPADRRRGFGGLDPEGRFDAELYDRYASFIEARDAALSSIEIMLDEADYDGDDHQHELEQMRVLLDASSSFDDLIGHSTYQQFVERIEPLRACAA